MQNDVPINLHEVVLKKVKSENVANLANEGDLSEVISFGSMEEGYFSNPIVLKTKK